MEYTTLGATVSRICLGCMSYGSSQWRPWMLDPDDAMPFFRRAIEAGINPKSCNRRLAGGEKGRFSGSPAAVRPGFRSTHPPTGCGGRFRRRPTTAARSRAAFRRCCGPGMS
jgi:hypothetical protein